MFYYVTGEPTRPKRKPALIFNICNGKGFWSSLDVDKLSPRPRNAYLAKACYELSEVQFVSLSHSITVANLIVNQSTKNDTSYPDLARAFYTINEWCDMHPHATVHTPLFGDWLVTEALFDSILKQHTVFIYENDS